MPLFIPIIIVASALAGVGWGAKKGVDGVRDIKTAKLIAAGAEAKYRHNMNVLEQTREGVNRHANQFGTFKLEVTRATVGSMVQLLEELERRGKVSAIDHLQGVDFQPTAFLAEMRELTGTATRVLGGIVLGAVKGSLTGVGIYGLAGSIGIASTGAAISGLSGAAAESATLAWLGGGALAAGGWGMAGGMVVLGGIVAAPVFLIAGYAIAKQGSKALTNAESYASDVDVAVATMDSMREALRLVRLRMKELQDLVAELQMRADAAIQSIRERLESFSIDTMEDATKLAGALNLCKSITELMRAPVIVGSDGSINPDIPNLIARHRTLNP
jgi:hypothetical protein